MSIWCRNLYMTGHMVENAAQTMDSDMVNYLKRPHDLIVKLKGVFFSQPFGFVYALFSIRRM